MKIERFEDLEIWREARELCRRIKQLTTRGAFSRDFDLRNQIRDSSGSIMDCIAEGFERGGNKEFVQFLSIAKGSSGETRSQSYRAFDYEYISEEDLNDLLDRTVKLSKQISSFMNYLRRSDFKGSKFH
ncbi:MAG TPA: four helix bundle protein [Bacteroidota bacterium]|nr:four helix bundle protein [Bacteroidota bacterium]